MLKKTVSADIIPSRRICKCGKTVSIDPLKEKTYCDCGELIHDSHPVQDASSDK